MVSSLQDIIIIKQNNELFYCQDATKGGFVCFVSWREGSSGWTSDAWFTMIFVRARGLSTSCVQTAHTLRLCLEALTGAGGGGGVRGGRGCGSAEGGSTLSPRYSNFCLWHVEALGPSILPLTAQLLIQAGESRQIWCRLAALKS